VERLYEGSLGGTSPNLRRSDHSYESYSIAIIQGGANVVWKRPGLLIPISAADRMLAVVNGAKYNCFYLHSYMQYKSVICNHSVCTASVERDRQLIGSSLITFEIADLIASSSQIVLPKSIVTEIYNKEGNKDKTVRIIIFLIPFLFMIVPCLIGQFIVKVRSSRRRRICW